MLSSPRSVVRRGGTLAVIALVSPLMLGFAPGQSLRRGNRECRFRVRLCLAGDSSAPRVGRPPGPSAVALAAGW